MSASESDSRPRDPITDQLVDSLYGELRTLARAIHGPAGHGSPVDATELLHEAYLKLARVDEFRNLGRERFLAFAATVLRSVLVDQARKEGTLKRGGGKGRTTLTGIPAEEGPSHDVDLLALDTALRRLKAKDERMHSVVELRYFAGLTLRETASVLETSERMISREWEMARAWLHREMTR